MVQKLTKSYLFLASLYLCAGLFLSGAHAKEVTEQSKAQDSAEKPTLQDTEALRDLEDYTSELLNGLAPPQAQYLYNIRQEFGVIRSIRIAQEDIGRAVVSCAEKHEETADEIKARFDQWTETIEPEINRAKQALEAAIERQVFRPTSRVNSLLEKLDAAFAERDAQMNKVPVTTKKACEGLLNSLDQTQKDLGKILEETRQKLNGLSSDVPTQNPAETPVNDPEES